MTLYGMPFLLINLGGEMIYILEQRLNAQNVSKEKSKKGNNSVLQDVISSMFNKDFLNELMKPQVLYSNASIRGIFQKLAHSSIMRLSSQSMDKVHYEYNLFIYITDDFLKQYPFPSPQIIINEKLYDLMSMGLKLQLLSCSDPTEIVQFTLNHLDNIQKICNNVINGSETDPKSQDALECVRNAIEKICNLSKDLHPYDFCIIRQRLLRYFKEKNVKVSLFLQCGMQNKSDGSLTLNQIEEVPFPFETPGKVSYFDPSGKIAHSEMMQNHPLRHVTCNAHDHLDIDKRSSEIGKNMYSKENKKKIEEQSIPSNQTSKDIGERPTAEKSSTNNQSELSLLAKLIGVPPAASKQPLFKLNLFGDASFPDENEIPFEGTSKKMEFICTKSMNDDLDNVMNNLSFSSGGQETNEDDLLSLMDKAN